VTPQDALPTARTFALEGRGHDANLTAPELVLVAREVSRGFW
jgi:hypothetical protein